MVVENTGALKQINLYKNLSCTSKKLVVMGESYHLLSLKKKNWEHNYCDRELLGAIETLARKYLAWSWQIFGDNYETSGKKETLILRELGKNLDTGGKKVSGKKNMLIFTRRKYSKKWWGWDKLRGQRLRMIKGSFFRPLPFNPKNPRYQIPQTTHQPSLALLLLQPLRKILRQRINTKSLGTGRDLHFGS